MAILLISLAIFFGSTVHTSYSEQCSRYYDVNRGSQNDARFTKSLLHNVILTPGLLKTVTAKSKIDCSRKCVATDGCVLASFQPGQHAPAGTCRLHGQLPSGAGDWEPETGARSYILNTSDFGRVPNDYTLRSGHCLRILSEAMTYQQASQRCGQLDHGHLLFAKTEDTIALGHAILREYGFPSIWVGADDLKEEGHFTWADGSSLPINRDLWQTGEPNDLGSADCVQIWESYTKLDDVPCYLSSIYTVCQRDM